MINRFSNWTPLSTTQQLIKSFNDHPDADGWLTANKSSDLEKNENQNAAPVIQGVASDDQSTSYTENISDLKNSKNENQKAMHGIPCIASDWMKVEKGGNNQSNQVISGTYIHPSLLPALGMWISPKFYYLAAKIIENFAIRVI